MKKQTYFCDFCGEENPRYKHYQIPVLTDCEWTEGHPTPTHIEFEYYDICKDCMIKITNVHAGFQGAKPTLIRIS